MHGGFKYGIVKTGWRFDRLMHLPGDMITEKRTLGWEFFPLKFCNTCWLEDISVAERDMAMWLGM